MENSLPFTYNFGCSSRLCLDCRSRAVCHFCFCRSGRIYALLRLARYAIKRVEELLLGKTNNLYLSSVHGCDGYRVAADLADTGTLTGHGSLRRSLIRRGLWLRVCSTSHVALSFTEFADTIFVFAPVIPKLYRHLAARHNCFWPL